MKVLLKRRAFRIWYDHDDEGFAWFEFIIDWYYGGWQSGLTLLDHTIAIEYNFKALRRKLKDGKWGWTWRRKKRK